MKETKEVMNIEELAEYLGISKWTLYRKVEHKEIPAAKIGTQWRFSKAVIDTWLSGKMTEGNSKSDYLQGLKVRARLSKLK